MKLGDRRALLYNIIISCGYGLFFIVFKALEFKELFVSKKVFSSFSLGDYIFNFALLKAAFCYMISFFVLYVLVAIVCWYTALNMIGYVRSSERIKKLFCCLYLTGFLYLISILNAIVYPNTITLRLNSLNLIIAIVIGIVFFISIIVLSVRVLEKWKNSKFQKIVKYTGAFGIIIFLLVFMADSAFLSKGSQTKGSTLPNIIIVSLDSFVPALTNFHKKDKDAYHLTPNIDHFLERSTVFENAWTPFARTYPAWMSLLTGTYPIKNGARYNLIDPELLNKNNIYLPDFLRHQGYQTVFGSDEKRFSNIDERYGFDILVGPKMGAADFLLAPILDTPLTNLLINTRLGKILFPYNHSNRAIHDTYQPKVFVRNVKRKIKTLKNRPVFLSLHLCLPHWPYTWAKKKASEDRDRYLESVDRVDKQFDSLLSMLEKDFLKNALVIVISDHGESEYPLEDNQSIFLSETGNEEFFTRLPGHGTLVTDKTQSNILLGIRGFGDVKNVVRATSQPVSLIDIFPTILEILAINNSYQHFDGISLAPWIVHQQNPPVEDRYLFFESGYNPGGLKNVFSNNGGLNEIVATGIGSYRIIKDGKIVLKKEFLNELNLKKQYAVFYKDRAVAIIPGEDGVKTIGLNYARKKWKHLSSPNQDNDAYEAMLSILQKTYIKEE